LAAAVRGAAREPINYAWQFGSRLRHLVSLIPALEWADPQDDPHRLSVLHRHCYGAVNRPHGPRSTRPRLLSHVQDVLVQGVVNERPPAEQHRSQHKASQNFANNFGLARLHE
jgi:hypothetical protein